MPFSFFSAFSRMAFGSAVVLFCGDRLLGEEHSKQEVGIVTEADQLLMSPAAALERLSQGNERFVSGHRAERDWKDQVHDTARGEHPFASIVSCMDSRTSVEQVFDLGFGDVFSVRIAGNVIDEDVLGSLEYAHKVGGAKLVVVMGHNHCGAMKSAVDDTVLGNLTGLLARVKPSIVGVADDGTPRTSANSKFVDKVSHLNVILMVRMIRERSAVLRELQDRHLIDIVGAFYDLETGKVEFYKPMSGDTAEPVKKSPAPVAAATSHETAKPKAEHSAH